MAISRTANNFIRQTASSIRTIATVDLFNGDWHNGSLKLALDYAIPVLKVNDNQDYTVKLIARIQYVEKGVYREGIVAVSSRFYQYQLTAGPMNWSGTSQSLALQLVTGMRVHIQHNFDQPSYRPIIQGDNAGLESHMKRLYIL